MKSLRKPALFVVPMTAAWLALSASLAGAQESQTVTPVKVPVSAPATASPRGLTIGDPAPALRPAKWLKGAPVTGFQKGKLYVVEFWATWCGPCKANIPHLTELARKYKDRGVTVIGTSIWEDVEGGDKDYQGKVAAFVAAQGAAMDYTVAVDGPKNEIADAWMAAAGEKGIPCSFLIDGDGKVAWIGYPTEMDAVLEKVLAKTYDPAPAREKRETAMRLLRPIDEAMEAKDYAAAARRVETAIAEKPELFVGLAHSYLVALFHADPEKGKAVARRIVTESKEPGAYQLIGSIFATQSDLTPETYRFGVGMLDEAIRLWPDQFLYAAMKADVVFRLGDRAEALRLAKGALAAAEGQPQPSANVVALIRKNIGRYEKGR